MLPGPLFTKKMPSYGYGIPIINLRGSDDRLRFIMGIPILIRRRLHSEDRPSCTPVKHTERPLQTGFQTVGTKKSPSTLLIRKWWFYFFHLMRNAVVYSSTHCMIQSSMSDRCVPRVIFRSDVPFVVQCFSETCVGVIFHVTKYIFISSKVSFYWPTCGDSGLRMVSNSIPLDTALHIWNIVLRF